MAVNPLNDRKIERRFSFQQSMDIECCPRPWTHKDNQRDLKLFIEETNRTRNLLIQVSMEVGGEIIRTGIRAIDELAGDRGIQHVEVQAMLTKHTASRATLTTKQLHMHRSIAFVVLDHGQDDLDIRFDCTLASFGASGIVLIPA